MASMNTHFKNREDMKRARELEEARKAGLAPAEVDQETGQEINPHIPNYMTSAPWYLNQDKPSLKHQKDWRKEGEQKGNEWYQRGVVTGQAKKWRKGACENCGSMTHKAKDCLERPRKVGAKHTNAKIAPDELVQDLNITKYDQKRDRWNGYTADDYAEVVQRYEAIQEARQEVLRAEEKAARYAEDARETSADGGANGDEDKIADDEQADFSKVEKRARTAGGGVTGSVRNLRIREDTAKYLLNLDPKSAHYDPKSRSMREDPNPLKPAHEKTFAGDNAVRHTGEYDYFRQLTQHSVMQQEKGAAIHMQGAPSQAEMLHASFKEKKAKLANQAKKAVLEAYGNAAAADELKDELLLPQSEGYVEYDRTGRVIKGQEVKARSRYEEDVFVNNHTSVWGSFWQDGNWGYACCKSFVKNSMCLGSKAEDVAAVNAEVMAENAKRRAEEQEKARADAAEGKNGSKPVRQDNAWGTDVGEDVELDQAKVQEALQKLRAEAAARAANDYEEGNDRKRKYNSLAAGEGVISNEEMEAYRLNKERTQDPLAEMRKRGDVAGSEFV